MAPNQSAGGRACGRFRVQQELKLRRWLAVVLFVSLIPGVLGDSKAALGQTGPNFSGLVTDQQGVPVASALVDVNGLQTLSGKDGSFQLSVTAQGPYILNISQPDFADASYVSQTLPMGQTWPLVRSQVGTIDPTTTVTIVDGRPELADKGIKGAIFTLPANSIVDPAGNPPAGLVRTAIATLDVANGEGPGNWAVRSDDGLQDGYLVSYGAVFLLFTSPDGSVRYQLGSGSAGQLSLPVIPAMQGYASTTPKARFWYYDPKDSYWKYAGDTSFDPPSGAYVGNVYHLSTINTDIAQFNNAACLSIMLDASVPPGSRLRIRYNSGPTPFGQTPILVLNDPVNAVFRLPANTNVLLELLDANNGVAGNLVVEDPPGTPLVNNVVNTGPPIPPGQPLCPPAPYKSCKPLRLRLVVPQVEIRINELATDPANLADDPTDDYVTWAPTFCRARLTTPMNQNVNVVLTNDAPGAIPGGGDVLFAAYQNPWPVNTTATAQNLALALPGNGAWVSFVIAGKFGSPSTNDKDTIIEAHLNAANGALVGTKALMVRVRKNGNNLTAAERSRFLMALRAFRNQGGGSNYLMFQEMHRLATTVGVVGDQAHGQPAFLPWHRAMLLQVERELQKIDPSVTLPYWNWDAAAPNIFSQDFIGASPGAGAGAVGAPIFAANNPLNGWSTDLPFSGGQLRRNRNDHTLAPAAGTFKPLDSPGNPSLVDRADYGPRNGVSFSTEVEELAHNPAHGWPCAGGHLALPIRSAADPLFYLLHSQTERQWAYWQWKNNRFGTVVVNALTFPAPGHYDNNGNWNDPGVTDWQKGSFLEDGMWPWDGTSGGPAGRAQRPVNQAPAPPPVDQNVPNSRPAVPMAQLPASPRRNLWPAAAAVPRPRDTIDYLGKFRPQDGLGFCYDDVPYN
jgi:tyrosinase